MNGAPAVPPRRIERWTLLLGAAAFAASAAFVWLQPQRWADAWLFAVFTLLQPAIGSLILLLIHRLTGGQWGESLRAFLHAGTALLPWIWLLLLPLLFVTESPLEGPEAEGALALYLGRNMKLVRFVAIGLVLTLFSRVARHDLSDTRLRWVGPAGLIALVFLLHLVAVDWLFALHPGWYSTGFPLIWITGNAVSGLSAAIALAVATGRRPATSGASGRPEGIDWGNLLLACVLFWSYLAFTHFLIMWMGNLSEEIAWYAERATPLWKAVIALLAVFHLALPLVVLCFRGFKRSASGLAALAVMLALLQAVHTGWLIFPSAHVDGTALATAVLLAVAALALFLNRYTRLARRFEERMP